MIKKFITQMLCYISLCLFNIYVLYVQDSKTFAKSPMLYILISMILPIVIQIIIINGRAKAEKIKLKKKKEVTKCPKWKSSNIIIINAKYDENAEKHLYKCEKCGHEWQN